MNKILNVYIKEFALNSFELYFNGQTWEYSTFRKCVSRLVSLLVLKYLWDE